MSQIKKKKKQIGSNHIDTTKNINKNVKTTECNDTILLKSNGKRDRTDKSIVGKKIGKLTVIELDFIRKEHSYWKCTCDCGGKITSERSGLLHQKITHCGCLNLRGLKERENPAFQDLTGKKFNKLKVIKLNKFKSGSSWWDCECDCGNKSVVRATNLNQGRTKTCGCLRNRDKRINLTGQKFGTYKVIKYVRGKGRLKTKGSGNWECKCDCGNTVYLSKDSVQRTKHGCRKCYGKSFCGKKHQNWNPSLSKKDRADRRNLPELKIWRISVYERDEYTCQVTGIKGGKLCAHHLESYHSNKKLRFVLTNGITLLKSVHKYFHKLYGNRNNTRQQFEEFKNNLTRKELKKLKINS